MKNEKMLSAIGQIDDNLVHNAVNDVPKKKTLIWVKVGAMAACCCLILCGLFWMQNKNTTPLPPVVDDNPISSSTPRGDTAENTDVTQPSTPIETGEKISVYKISTVGINSTAINEMQDRLKAADWADVECPVFDDYGFVFKGPTTDAKNDLSSDECIELAKLFLSDSGLNTLFEQMEMAYEFSAQNADGLIVTYCYFTCDGERTGAYIRFIFEDNKYIGEVQAHLYSSECIDTLPPLALDEALLNAKKVNADGGLVAVNAADYSIKYEKLVYINGLPYYQFNGYGINIREFINGYALAVDISASEISEQLIQQHLAFKVN